MAKTLVINFINEQGKKVSINLSTVKDSVTQKEVSATMDTIIAKNVFHTSGGDLKVKNSAQLVEKTTEELAIK